MKRMVNFCKTLAFFPPDPLIIRVLVILMAISSLFSWWRVAGAMDFPKSDEQVILFPALAWQAEGPGFWHAEIHGWIFEPDFFGDLLEPLRAALGLPELDQTSSSMELWRQRGRWFTADNERGKRLSVRVGAESYPLTASQANGHFSTLLSFPDRPPAQFAIEMAVGDKRRFTGELLAIPPEGLSIVSDIDDTIKLSQVLDKSELLRNTFLRPYKMASGMAELYQDWQSAGAVFHYVSASPWQLYTPLREFMDQAGFPPGSFHLRYFRWKDESAFNLLQSSSGHKTLAIETLMTRYPKRDFVLVGDAGEHDPEVYGDIARRFPERIKSILIRSVAGADLSSARWQSSFGGIDPSRWRIFSDPAEIER